jgi:hypothetical protein
LFTFVHLCSPASLSSLSSRSSLSSLSSRSSLSSLSSLLQQEIITNVGYDMPLIAKAVGGKGNGTVLKRRKSGASGSNKGQATYLNKGDDIGVDNHIVCNVRSMMGKLSKNIVVQLEAPIHVENKLTVPIYLRLTSNGAQYNDHHPSDETYGLPIIEGKALGCSTVVQRETNKSCVDHLFFQTVYIFFFVLISSNNNFICFNNTWNTVFCVAMCQCECSFFFLPTMQCNPTRLPVVLPIPTNL